MIRVFKSGEVARADILYRGESGSTQAVEDAVADILADVKKNGDAAVLRYCEKFDGVKLAGLRVAQADIDAAYEAADPEFIRTLTMAAGNIEAFHKRQIRRNFVINDTPGVVLGQKVTPIERVGLYVPGGTASYPSSVLMNAIPARLAGVSEIIMVTPPAKDGSVAPAILTAARVAGVTAIYKMGGAQAVAALAYGTESVPKVDKIVGPGNIFVAAAKRRVYGIVDIDMIAGPSEILVLADAAANPAYVAADLPSTTGWPPRCWCATARRWPGRFRRSWSGRFPCCPGRTSPARPSTTTARSSLHGTWPRAWTSPTRSRPSIWRSAWTTRSAF